ncbi:MULTISPECIES: histidine kinase [unclassified Paenibacillus]|uniref:sensor histidine kinase n=1 Tax=unclassified Paenibacillus TaxID=185978 RepID=UPI00240511E7|nr:MULTISPECIES: histidine kinase [unclassified Paenibacillus]MDF9840183.1 two-component system NarL family sensor kinase [Paenibacillus sp. PastF-2]MDF9846765.1 two-component system NarL family sensor kinase [Paenibacillus sp. PastM-2]MDF9852886.1 two-component system NarL family sensor kinase [Paenibacillus sp. PastF-1]MDH6478609.1 two-component system NarL family sensor kinase [Paenibacillus sp. PastH-2]MDH6505893.1 two-component system NarL family sensor kinase [Paenibacillus sp. PastM-3]
MTRELRILRYGLLIIPAVLSVYVYDYPDYGLFTFYFLMQLLLATAGSRLPKPFPALAVTLELLYSAWMCREYGLLMIFPAVSALLCYSRLQPKVLPVLLTCLHLGALNAAFGSLALQELIYMNLTFLLAAGLNELLWRAGRGREDTLFLYDELRKKHFELDEARNRLLQFASQVENAAQAEERVRISRQLHDDIGHRLIRVKMMVEAAIHTLPVSPEAGMGMMGQIRDQLAASMDDMRTALRQVNHAPQLEGAYALDRLLEETGRDTGIETSYQVEGYVYPLYPSIQVVLYKNAREALTNALRHGKATSAWISVNYSEREVIMEVGNNGLLPEDDQLRRLQTGGGMGLKGMSERTSLVGGTLEVRAGAPFTVVTRLPVYRQGDFK